jgi:stearoyl-CoA desaturase (delta-9 desaturase)
VFKLLVIAPLVGLAVTLGANVLTTVYLHRAAAHKALSLRPEAAFVFRLLLWLSTGIKPREWVAVHRKHHAYTDVAGDPHSPVLLGWKQVQMKNVALYRKSAKDPDTVNKYAKDMPPDVLDRWVFDRSLLGLAIGIGILLVTLGPWAGLLAAFVHVNLYLGGSAAVNAIGHHFGRKPYANGAGNLQWLAWLTAGEGLHNNHHAVPSGARLSHRRWEFDPGWWVINVLRGLGLAKVRLDGAVVRAKAAARPARPARSAA